MLVKRACTTAQNIYDRPTVSTLRDLLAPVPPPTETKLPWQDEQDRLLHPLSQRALTQQATALWEEDGRLLAYAILVAPSLVLTFQVHPQALGLGIEGQILTWA